MNEENNSQKVLELRGELKGVSESEEAKEKALALLDFKIRSIADSTRTSVPAMSKLHNWIRTKLSWYYDWHVNPWSKVVHQFILLILIILIVAAVILFGNKLSLS